MPTGGSVTIAGCNPMAINYGQTIASVLTGLCVVGGENTDLYTFSGTAGEQIAVVLDSQVFSAQIQLVDPFGSVAAVGPGGAPATFNETLRLPASGFYTLANTGTYTIRAIATGLGSGAYSVSLNRQQAMSCTYSLSRPQTNVPSGGGTFYFDVSTQPGCPSADQPAPSGAIYTNVSYQGGAVTFDVAANPGTADRQDAIFVAGQFHTIFQYGLTGAAERQHRKCSADQRDQQSAAITGDGVQHSGDGRVG